LMEGERERLEREAWTEVALDGDEPFDPEAVYEVVSSEAVDPATFRALSQGNLVMGGVYDLENVALHGAHHLNQTKRRYPVTCKSPVSLSYLPLSGDPTSGHANYATLFRHEKRKSYVAQSKPPVGGAARFRSEHGAPAPPTGGAPAGEWAAHGRPDPPPTAPAWTPRYGGPSDAAAAAAAHDLSVPICYVYAIYKKSSGP